MGSDPLQSFLIQLCLPDPLVVSFSQLQLVPFPQPIKILVSSTPITLHIGERFCTVIFFYCKTPTLSAPTSRAIEGANSVAFTDYINSNVYSQINSIFETKKQKALSRPSYWIQQLKWKITSLFFQKVNKNTIFLFLFILFCIIGLCLMLGAYKFLKLHYHWSNNSIAFFLAYLSICISLLIAWLSSH